MDKIIRTFIAVKIIPEKKLMEVLSTLQQQLVGEAINWVKPNNLHITLKFLGNTPIGKVDEIKGQLETIAGKNKKIEGEINGLGYFKSQNQPRVLFANMHNVDLLKVISKEIETKMESLGFDLEKRNFKSHLTLARIKFLRDKTGFYQLVDKYKNDVFQQVQIGEVIFYQSILKPEGPEYQPILIVKLKE